MKIKKIKHLIDRIYYRGVYDGLDITKAPHDEFMGNMEARISREHQFIEAWLKEIKEYI